MNSGPPASSYERIWAVVARIPHGRVATYGQVARLAGLGRRARLVGYALHRTPADRKLPWHRVINAKGEISFAAGHPHYEEQRRRLQREGIRFEGTRVDLRRYRWQEDGHIPAEYFLET